MSKLVVWCSLPRILSVCVGLVGNHNSYIWSSCPSQEPRNRNSHKWHIGHDPYLSCLGPYYWDGGTTKRNKGAKRTAPFLMKLGRNSVWCLIRSEKNF
eukprot:sb/3478844/